MGVSSTQEEICPIEAIGGFVRAVTFSEVPAQSAGWRCFLWKIADPFRKGFLTHFDEDDRKFEKSSSNKSAFIFWRFPSTEASHGCTVLFLGQVTVPDTRRVWTCPTHHYRF